MSIQNQLENMVKAESSKPDKKRLTVTLTDVDYRQLEKQAEKLGITKTKCLNLLVASAISSLG